MKKSLHILSFIITMIVAFGINAIAAEDRIESKELMDTVMIKAEVAQINYETREVTLAGPEGNLVTLEATDEIQRFNEIEVGDIIAAKYMTYTLAEFREPTQEEMDNPMNLLIEGGKSAAGDVPAGAMGTQVRAVVSVEQINLENKEVTIKGPRGNYLTIPVEDDEVLKQRVVGEFVVLTYAEAVALSLEKVAPVEVETSKN